MKMLNKVRNIMMMVILSVGSASAMESERPALGRGKSLSEITRGKHSDAKLLSEMVSPRNHAKLADAIATNARAMRQKKEGGSRAESDSLDEAVVLKKQQSELSGSVKDVVMASLDFKTVRAKLEVDAARAMVLKQLRNSKSPREKGEATVVLTASSGDLRKKTKKPDVEVYDNEGIQEFLATGSIGSEN